MRNIIKSLFTFMIFQIIHISSQQLTVYTGVENNLSMNYGLMLELNFLIFNYTKLNGLFFFY